MIAAFLCAFLAASATPDIVFISVDTLRADRLGCYGHTGGLTPHIDALATRAVLFEDMICEEPQTGPSMISMFTSIFPPMTGTIRNSVPVSTDVTTAPELLQQAGYETSAVVSNWNLKRKLSHLDQGFAVYDDDFGKGRWGRERTERDAADVTDRALELLDTQGPLFLWVHYMDPHDPYELHDEYSPGISALRKMNGTEQARARYNAEVAYMDHHLGRLLDAIPGDTVIVLTADHGECLNEHGYIGHTHHVWQQTMHIPLLIAGPGIAPRRETAPARGIDIAPTLLALANLQPAPEMLGLNLLGGPLPLDRVRVVETYGGDVPTTAEGREALAQRPPRHQAVYHDGWKLITGSRSRLYCLEADPAERRNLRAKHPTHHNELETLRTGWETSVPRGATDAAELDEADIRALEATGYL